MLLNTQSCTRPKLDLMMNKLRAGKLLVRVLPDKECDAESKCDARLFRYLENRQATANRQAAVHRLLSKGVAVKAPVDTSSSTSKAKDGSGALDDAKTVPQVS